MSDFNDEIRDCQQFQDNLDLIGFGYDNCKFVMKVMALTKLFELLIDYCKQ